MLLAALRESGNELRRRLDVAALAQHRLENHRRGLFRRGERLQHVVETLQCVRHFRLLILGERVGERCHEDARGQRRVPRAIAGLAGGHRHRHRRTAVKAAGEHDDVWALGRLLGQLDRRFRDLGTGVSKEEGVDGLGRDFVQLAGQRFEQVVVEYVDLRVDEALRLVGDGFGDGRVRVAGGIDGDTSGEVEVFLAALGRDPTAFAVSDFKWGDFEPHVGKMRLVRHRKQLTSPIKMTRHVPSARFSWPAPQF